MLAIKTEYQKRTINRKENQKTCYYKKLVQIKMLQHFVSLNMFFLLITNICLTGIKLVY